jgi:hypothetical protein
LSAAATNPEIPARAGCIGRQLLGEQAVIKGGPPRIKAAEEIDPALNRLLAFGALGLAFVALGLRSWSPVLSLVLRHLGLLRPLAARGFTVAALISATWLPSLGFGALTPASGVSAAAAPATPSKPSLRGSQGTYTASVFVAASPQKAWQVLSNYGAMAGVMPDIKEAQVLSRNGASLVLRQTYQAPYTFGLRVNATLAVRENKPHQLSYSLISSEHIRQLKGSWAITPVAGGVLLRHTIQVDPRAPDLLRPLYFELSEANLLQSMAILKRLIEQGG